MGQSSKRFGVSVACFLLESMLPMNNKLFISVNYTLKL